MKKSITKILAVLLVAVLTLSLASCSAKKNNNDSQLSNADTDIATLMSVEPRNAEEAADLYQTHAKGKRYSYKQFKSLGKGVYVGKQGHSDD